MKIAVILTCFNRKQKTLSCLSSLFDARDNYQPHIELSIYLTDDGCTDGTTDAVRSSFPNEDITILQGDGNLYWAGGMRFAWQEALKRHGEWEYYLLINDDTDLLPNLFEELLKTEEYSLATVGIKGIVSGITSSKTQPYQLTYSGVVWKNKFLATQTRLGEKDVPQRCDLTNANILLVPVEIVRAIGVFYEGYIHGGADYDYADMANKAGIPVWITANACGRCDRDHSTHKEEYAKIINMKISQRKEYYSHPLHSLDQNILYARRVTPFRVPLLLIGKFMHIYLPLLLYGISKFRFNE